MIELEPETYEALLRRLYDAEYAVGELVKAWRESMRHQNEFRTRDAAVRLIEGIKEMIDDVIVAINAAQAMADRFNKVLLHTQ